MSDWLVRIVAFLSRHDPLLVHGSIPQFTVFISQKYALCDSNAFKTAGRGERKASLMEDCALPIAVTAGMSNTACFQRFRGSSKTGIRHLSDTTNDIL